MLASKDTDRKQEEFGVTEGARRASGVTPIGAGLNPPDPELPEKKPRRKFTAAYKLRVVKEAEACTEPGEIGALLRRERLMKAARNLGKEVGTRQACESLGVSHATFYRWLKPQGTVKARPTPPLALSDQERHDVIQLLHCERFQDDAPRQIYAALLDEGRYHCSIRTMYRILESVHGDVKERRKQVQRPVYEKPELLATTPNEV